jgi:hypothetical protein
MSSVTARFESAIPSFTVGSYAEQQLDAAFLVAVLVAVILLLRLV